MYPSVAGSIFKPFTLSYCSWRQKALQKLSSDEIGLISASWHFSSAPVLTKICMLVLTDARQLKGAVLTSKCSTALRAAGRGPVTRLRDSLIPTRGSESHGIRIWNRETAIWKCDGAHHLSAAQITSVLPTHLPLRMVTF